MNPISKKDELINLWHKALPEDKSDSVEWFCNNMLQGDDDVRTVYDQQTCAAAVGVTRTTLNYYGAEIPAALGSYLCVDPDYRDQGYSMAAGFSCIHYCSKRNIDLIIGWEVSSKLRRLYETVGQFIYRHCVKRTTVTRAELPAGPAEGYRIETTKRNIAQEYHALIAGRYRNYLIHTDLAFDMMGREGDFFLAYDALGELRGIAIRFFCTEDNYIEEFVATDEQAKNSLLSQIAAHYDWEEFTYSEYGVGVEGAEISHGMIRVLNAGNMLKRYAAAHPDFKDTFAVMDESVPENCKTYKVDRGICEVVPYDQTQRVLTIHQLSEMLFDGFYLNLCTIY